jgi:hypothetical protein
MHRNADHHNRSRSASESESFQTIERFFCDLTSDLNQSLDHPDHISGTTEHFRNRFVGFMEGVIGSRSITLKDKARIG